MPITDHLILDYWNGRPSVWMSANNGDPFLHWMLLGHNEPFDLWMHARMTWAVADRLAENPVDKVDDVLAQIPGALVRFVLEDSGRPLLFTDWSVPRSEPHLADGLRLFAGALLALMQQDSDDRDALKIASNDLEPLLV